MDSTLLLQVCWLLRQEGVDMFCSVGVCLECVDGLTAHRKGIQEGQICQNAATNWLPATPSIRERHNCQGSV